jgi:hypothetical protein
LRGVLEPRVRVWLASTVHVEGAPMVINELLKVTLAWALIPPLFW